MFFKRKIEKAEELPQVASNAETPLDKLRSRSDNAQLPLNVSEAVSKELEKLEKTDPSVAEYSVGFNYIELVISLPWNLSSPCKLELARAQTLLDTRHYGLTQVK